MGELLTADQIFAADDQTKKRVEVPEWGGDVLVRALTGTERDSYEASMSVQRGDRFEPNPVGARARLVVRAAINANGDRLFQDNQADELGNKNGAVLDRLWDAIAELSGMTSKSVKDAEGNSADIPADASTSS
jgi:hypothetical protein